MTGEKFSDTLPRFAGEQLGIKPPLLFNRVSARIFPLRANLDTLQQLCDQYLNFVPREAGYFRAVLPYVNLVLLDYGHMGESMMRTGWFSQIEVYFGLTVEWYKLVRGQWQFHDWGVITPYIFVTDNISVPVGRTVYGFPKVLAEVEMADSRWMKDSDSPVTLARIATTVFPEAYTGGNLETRVFLEVQKSGASSFRAPFDSKSPIMPWTVAGNIADAVAGFGRDAMWLAQMMRIFPVNPFSSPGFIPEMLGRMPAWFAPGGEGFVLNSLNVKQFRHASDPTKICYQALTNGCMQTTGFNGGGLLGEGRILLGDLSGGHTVRLYEHSSLPIARTLGLEAARSSRADDVAITELHPVMPFWINVDLKYDRGTNVVWRTATGIWRDADGAQVDPEQKPAEEGHGPDFNNAVSTAIEAIAGPFQFIGTTIRVIPLLADKKTLQGFLDDYLNTPLRDPIIGEDGSPEEVEFEVWAHPPQAINTGSPIGGDTAYVYLAASSFEGVTSSADNVGDWAKFELAFMIPVRWKRKVNDEWLTVGIGLVPAFTFADNCITAISRMEIQGIAAGTAQFERPENVWLSQGATGETAQTVLRVKVEVLPALGTGQKATAQPVIEINQRDPRGGLGDAPDGPWRWAEQLRHELGMKKGAKQQYWNQLKIARALALELLGNQTQFSLYTLKQFRDVTDPDRACYQSLVRVPRKLTEVFDLREIEETLAVRIYDYPSLNIVDTLGIKAARLEDSAAGIVYAAQGIRPFYIRATMDEPLAEALLSRAGRQWTVHHSAFHTFLSNEPDAPRITVDGKAETLQDQMDPSRTAETMFQAQQRWAANTVCGPITAADARAAVANTDAQMIIESALSREWSNFDPNARWRKGRAALLKGFNALPEAGELKPYAEAELYRQINNLLAAPPGSVAGRISMGDSWDTAYSPPPAPSYDGLSPDSSSGETTVQSQLRVILENLRGDGAAIRWRNELKEIIKSEMEFTAQSLKLEQSVDALSPLPVLGLKGVRDAYVVLNQRRAAQNEPPLAVPTADQLLDAGKQLKGAMDYIQGMEVIGEPSPHNNLDTGALAGEERLRELLAIFAAEMKDELKPDEPADAQLESAIAHSTEEGEMVALARQKCDVQFDALINKLSRAYQKPDFCIRRDGFPLDNRDRLLPPTLSWNEDWYYGEKIVLSPDLALEIFKQSAAPGETQSSPAESPPEAGS